VKRLAPLVVLASLLIAPTAHAYNWVGHYWLSNSVVLNYNDGSFSSSSLDWTTTRNQLGSAAGTWTQPACTVLSLSLGSSTTSGYGYDGENVISMESTNAWRTQLYLDSAIYGWTIDSWNDTSYDITDSDVIFNGGAMTDPTGAQQLYWSSMAGAPDELDFQSIALHEFGHVIGLGHNGSPGASVMYPALAGGTLARSLHQDDVDGVCFLYTNPFSMAGMNAECTTDHDCATGTCAFDGTNHTCAYRCTTDCDCPSGNGCGMTATPGVSVCSTGANTCPTTGGRTFAQNGASCTHGIDCLSSLCYTPTTGSAFCTNRCNTDCDCNAAYTCDATVHVCVTATGATHCTMLDGGTVADAGHGGLDGGVRDGGSAPPTGHSGCAVASADRDSVAWLIVMGLALVAHRARRRVR